MAAKGSVQYGGHDHQFVCDVPDRFICQICTKVLRDPHLAVCCGQHFCGTCLDRWFTRQDRESCPHCRAEGEAFHHVIHKGLRSEINQLKIRCSNHGEGCQWTGELGALKKHLESDSGCGYVVVVCPNKCLTDIEVEVFDDWSEAMDTSELIPVATTMKRKDMHEHLTQCYLRPHECEFCGLEDTYEAITGQGLYIWLSTIENPYGGHQAECPEAPLTCPNKCGSTKIRRKDMESHRSQCPQESVECPFAETGCKEKLKHCEVEIHMSSNQQQHLLLVMKDYRETKRELSETKRELFETKGELSETKKELLEAKGSLTTAVQLLRQGREADKETVDYVIACSSKLTKTYDSVKVIMPKFSEYRRSGKVWHSPPFYYREGYKMCLAVYANGVGNIGYTHISVTLLLLKGEHDIVYTHQLVVKCNNRYCTLRETLPEGQKWFNVCQYQPLSRYSKAVNVLSQRYTFCTHKYVASKLVNDCLTFNIEYSDECYLTVSVN